MCVFSVLLLVSTGFGEALKLDGSNHFVRTELNRFAGERESRGAPTKYTRSS